MVFTSPQFLFFFSAVVLLFYAMPRRFRTGFLLLASYCFYASFNPAYLVLLVFSTVVAWGSGLWIGNKDGSGHKKTRLAAGIVVSLAPLVFFKYFNFVNDSVRLLFDFASLSYTVPALTLMLPVGISFFTFRIVSYLVEVYRGTCPPEKGIAALALHIAFFPQLLAGPIERPGNLLPQLKSFHGFDYDQAVRGLRLMLWGFFKKLVIADRCAILVNQVYDNPASYAGYPLVLATYLFAFQIYCDFSGYTDMARGAARLLGFESMGNFKRPYFARSIAEFWKRWHISLSTWFRDYVYIPLGGSRVAVPRHYLNLLVVFIVSGLWHGAGWTFIAWGALHGVCMVFSLLFAPLGKGIANYVRISGTPALKNAIGMLITFHLVAAGWVFFRAHSIGDAWYVLTRAFDPAKLPVTDVPLGLGATQIAIAVFSILVMLFVEVLEERGKLGTLWAKQHRIVRWAVYAAIALACINLQAPVKSAFIYLQF
jgi:D-alanyl-lipoteichoic acid acyltransferase DltB (MBOAT superfamily)